MTLERSTYLLSVGSSTTAVLNLAAALISARTGHAVAAALSAITAVVCVWVLLFVQRRRWKDRVRVTEDAVLMSQASADRSLQLAIRCANAVEQIRVMIERDLDQSGAPREVIHDQQ